MSQRVEVEFPSQLILAAPERVTGLAWHRLFLEYIEQIDVPEQMTGPRVAELALAQDTRNRQEVAQRGAVIHDWVGRGGAPKQFVEVTPILYGESRRGPKCSLPSVTTRAVVEEGEKWLRLVRRWRSRRRSLSQTIQTSLHLALPFLSTRELVFVAESVGHRDFDWRDVVVVLLHYRRLALPRMRADARWIFEQAFGSHEARLFRERERQYPLLREQEGD